jgi:hypothetical protein
MFSAEMKLSWWAPDEWVRRKNPFWEWYCFCPWVTLYQIADTSEIWGHPLFAVQTVNNYWHYDDVHKPGGAECGDFIAYYTGFDEAKLGVSGFRAWLVDDPGVRKGENRKLWRRLSTLTQKFETCAVCEDRGSWFYEEVFGCVNWSYTVEDDGSGKGTGTYRLRAPYDVTEGWTAPIDKNGLPDEHVVPPVAQGSRTPGAAPSREFLRELRRRGKKVFWLK